tara:strand:+ start:130720 stop:131370 length:651 start_codon:yes stop_codon:yes gene_type:complete
MKGKIRTLLVDDHKIIRDGIRSILEMDENINIVDEAKDGTEALNIIARHNGKIDVVVLDINMPGLSGIDTTEIISKLYPKIKVLGLTMHKQHAYIVKMMEAGALGYVLKDGGGDQLIEGLKTVFQGKNYYSTEVTNTLVNGFVKKQQSKNEDFGLTKREVEIVKYVSEGLSNEEISKKIELSSRTVETHRRNIIKKMGVKNTAQMVARAIKKGVLK